MIFPANVDDNEEEREILALEGEDKKQSMTTKQILLAFLLIFGNVFISIAFSIIATFLPKTVSLFYFSIFYSNAFELIVSMGSRTTTKESMINVADDFTLSCYDLRIGFMDKVTSPSPFVGICIALRIFSGIGYVFYKGATYNTFSQNFPHNIAHVDENAVELIKDDRHFLSMYFTKELYYPLACIITMQMTIGYFDLALGSHAMKAFGFTPTLAGTMFIGYQVVYVIICPLVGRIVDKTHTEKKCMVIGNFLLMMVCVFIGPAPFLHIPETIWLTAVCLALVAITQAMSYIPSYKVLHRIALEMDSQITSIQHQKFQEYTYQLWEWGKFPLS
ncbi:MFS-type transporter SLC18B1 [Nymphon striatum]|nr:MFS-type transporter SLC18B1 [Nymphon striatum]